MVLCMSVKFYRVTEGEFIRMIETKTISKVIAQESFDQPLKFHVAGLNEQTNIAYMMRHGRVNELRTWRLDRLAMFLKNLDVPTFETQYKQ